MKPINLQYQTVNTSSDEYFRATRIKLECICPTYMLLLSSCRLTEDVSRQERVLLVFRHGPRLSGICEHHFTAGRGGLSRLAGIEECLQLELLVLLSESFGTLFISP